MKKLLVIFALLFTMGACSALPEGIMQSDSEGTALPTQGLPTETPMPTATIGYQATAHTALTAERASALTAESANLAVAKYTADAMAMELDRARITEAAGVLSALGTSQAINATGTAAPMVATQKAEAIAYDISKQTEVAHVPTQIYAEEQARLFVQNGERDANINFGIRIAAICMGIAFAIYLLAAAFATAIKASRPAQVAEVRDLNAEEQKNQKSNFRKVPTKDVQHYESKLLKTNIPCSPDQLLFLADWIVKKKMTLGLKSLEGTPVHKRMVGEDNLRDWLVWNEFAYELKSKQNGEIYMLEKGVNFFEDTLAVGSAPSFEGVQFTCRDKITEEQK
jgi:hypothetical protein